jgi:WD40 repeat protein
MHLQANNMTPISSFMSRYIFRSLAIMLLSAALVSCVNSQATLYPAPSLDDLKEELPGKLDLLNPKIADTAMTIAANYPGEYNINQVSAIYNRLAGGGWYYYSDPNNRDYFQNANITLQRGKISSTIGSGDCDDFAILMASLIESIGGSTRISFAYDMQNKSAHSYAEVYLGDDGDPGVVDIRRWLKDEYNVDEIVGINRTGDEIWLNLDWGSNSTKAAYPGGPSFGNQSQKTIRKIIWESDQKVFPKIVPVIDNMDSTDDWETVKNHHESAISIDSTPGKNGNGIQISYDLTKGGWVGISKRIDPALLMESTGLNLYYYYTGNKNYIELRLVCDDGKAFGASWSISKTEAWSSQNVLYSNLKPLDSKYSYELNKTGFNISKVRKIEFIISTPQDNTANLGTIILDDVKGTMAIPVGSPWARAEKERLKTDALDLALKSDTVRNTDLIKSVQFAVESLEDYETLAGNRALRKGLDLLPTPTFFLENDNIARKMVLSPNGKLLVCAGEGGGKVWDVANGREVSALKYDSWVNSIGLSPDSTRIVTANQDNTSYVWNASTGEIVHKLEHGGDVNAAAFSPDGRYIATASDDNTTRIWSASSGKEVSRLALEGRAYAVAFSPDGELLATAFFNDKSATKKQISDSPSLENAVTIWDFSKGKEMTKIQLHSDISVVAFSPDGSMLATGCWDGLACIWDAASGHELRRVELNGAVTSIAFEPGSNRMAVASWDKSARIYDLSNGNEVIRVQHNDFVNFVSFSPDGNLLATASDDNTARIWQVKSGKELVRIKHDGRVEFVSFSPDGTLIATKSTDNLARIWDISKLGEPIRIYHEASSMALCHDGKYMVTHAANNMAYMWDTTTGRELFRVNHDGLVNSIAFSPDDMTFATASDDKTVHIWDSSTGRELIRMNYDSEVESLAYSPDGFFLATAGDDKTARIWQISTGKEIFRMDHDDGVHTVVFSHDGRLLATAAYDNIAHVWDAATGKELARINHDEDRWICSIAFSPDDRYLATASSDTTARLWDIATGKEILRMHNDKWVLRIAFSPDGTKIATSCIDNLACIWNATSGARLATMNHEGMNGHDNEIRDIAFSPDSKYVATAGDDNTARIWDASTGSELARMEHDGRVNCVGFTQDGRRLVTASSDGTSAIWLLKPQDLICETCKRLTCNLSTPEWREQHCRACLIPNSSNESSKIAACSAMLFSPFRS